MKNFTFVLSVSLFSLSAFAGFDAPRTYSHHLFLNEKACLEARAHGGIMNCVQQISFTPDGKARVLVTDIQNFATYTLSGNQVVVKRTGDGDMDETLTFTVDRTGRNLVDSKLEVWELEQAGECR
jgi:hypothetical protein